MHKGSLEGLGDIRILLLRNHLFAYTNRRGLKLALILSLNGSVKANTSYAPKIGSYLILLRSGHLGGCLWCEGEGLPLCVRWSKRTSKVICYCGHLWAVASGRQYLLVILNQYPRIYRIFVENIYIEGNFVPENSTHWSFIPRNFNPWIFIEYLFRRMEVSSPTFS